jgi:malate dehydrogenase (oxaloacetate-decarboxylating)(NADP+)
MYVTPPRLTLALDMLTPHAGLRLLAMKPTPIEKFQYLVHLKATNVHLFYRLLSENIKVRSPADHRRKFWLTFSPRK